MSPRARWRRASLPLVGATLMLASLAFGGCGLLNEETPLPTAVVPSANVLANAGFEDGEEPWRSFAANPLTIVDDEAHGGQRSARLELTRSAPDGDSSIAAQTLNTNQFPEFVSGFYRADDWESGEDTHWLEFTVRVAGGAYGDQLPVHTLRIIIAGVQELPPPVFGIEPPGIATTFIRRDDPELREWTYFGYPVREAFLRAFQADPVGWDSVEFEVSLQCRSNACEPGAAVFFDDLYAGTQAGNTNNPSNP